MIKPTATLDPSKFSKKSKNFRINTINKLKSLNKDHNFPSSNRDSSNSAKYNHIKINNDKLTSLNSAALEMKNLISDFLENADEDEKKNYDIAEELKEIKENKNNIVDDDSDKDDDLNWGRSKTKGTNNPQLKKQKKKKKKQNNLFKTFTQFENWGKIKSYGANGISKDRNNNNIKDEFEFNRMMTQKVNEHRKENSIDFDFFRFGTKKSILNKGDDKKGDVVSLISKDKLKETSLSLEKKNVDLERKNSKNKKEELNVSNNKYIRKNSDKNYFANKEENVRGNNNSINNNIKTEEIYRRASFTLSHKGSLISNEMPNSPKSVISMQKETKNKNTKLQSKTEFSLFKKEESELRNFINSSKANYKEYNDICEDIKNNESHEAINSNIKEEPKNIISNNMIRHFSTDETNQANESSKNCLVDIKQSRMSLINEDNQMEKEENEKLKEMEYRCLSKQTHLVYDSLSDEEPDEEISGSFYIEPKSTFKFMWDMLIFFLSYFSLIETPYYMAFHIFDKPYLLSFHSISDYFIDTVFILDLLLGFFTAYYDFEEQLITRINLITLSYLRGWFLLDLISGFPFKSMLLIIRTQLKGLIHTYVVEAANMCDLLKLCRLIKIFKVCLHNNFSSWSYYHIMKYDSIRRVMTLSFYLFFFLISVHLLACVFIFLGQLDFPNWIYIQGLEMVQKSDIYIASGYFICATVFTVGYGDIISVSTYERSFNLFLLIVGIVIYSWVVTYLSNYVQKVDAKEQEYQMKVAILEQLRVTHEKMPSVLYDKISRFLKFQMKHEKKDTSDILDILPFGLRNKLIVEMYKDEINNFIFFKYYDNTEFIIKVLLKFRLILAEKNERLVNEGDYIEEIIFVKKGTLSLEIPLPVIIKEKKDSPSKIKESMTKKMTRSTTTYQQYLSEWKTKRDFTEKKQPKPSQQYIKIIEIRKNEHFGDILMFLDEKSPLSVKVRSKVAEIFLLNKTEAVEILPSFPKIWRKIMKRSIFNWEQIKRLINQSLRKFFKRNKKKLTKENLKTINIDNNQTKLIEMINNEKKNENDLELQEIPRDLDDNDSVEGDENALIDEDIQLVDKMGEEEENEEGEFEEEEEEEEEEENEDKDDDDEDGDNMQKVTNHNRNNQLKEVKEEENEENSTTRENNNNNENNKDRNNNLLAVSNNSVSSETARTNIDNQNINYFDTSDEDIINSKRNQKSKLTNSSDLINESQIRTLPYSVDEINKENFPFEPSIDIKENSLIPNIMPTNTNNNTSSSHSNSNNIIFKDELNHLASIHSPLSNSDFLGLSVKNEIHYDFAIQNVGNNNKTSFKDLNIVHVMEFTYILNSKIVKQGTLKKLNRSLTVKKLRKSRSLNSAKKGSEILKIKKTLRDQGENEENSNGEKSKRNMVKKNNRKSVFIPEKRKGFIGEFMNSNLSPKDNNKEGNKKKRRESNVLDFISFNIEQNSQNLNNSKSYYSKIFKKAMPELKKVFNEDDIKEEE